MMTKFWQWLALGIILLWAVGCRRAAPVTTGTGTAVFPTPPTLKTPTSTFQPSQPTFQPSVTPISATPTASIQTSEPTHAPPPSPPPPPPTEVISSPPDEIFPIPEARINPYAPTVYKNHIFVPVGNQLVALDFSEPSNIKEAGRRLLGGGITKLVVDGQYAYVLRCITNPNCGIGDWRSGVLEILDIRDPTHLRSIHSYAPATYRISKFAVLDYYAYIIETNGMSFWINKLDISNPVKPVSIGVFGESSLYPGYFAASSDFLYLTHARADRFHIRIDAYLTIFDTAVSETPQRIANYDLTTEVDDSPYKGISRYLAGQFDNKAYQIVQIPESGQVIPNPEWGSYDLHVLDMSDPTNPVELGLFHDVKHGMKMLTPTIGYWLDPYPVGREDDELYFYDLSSPPEVVEVSRYSIPGEARVIVLGTKDEMMFLLLRYYLDDYWYSFQLAVLDISDLTQPVEVERFTISSL